jgi:hypothetical protein
VTNPPILEEEGQLFSIWLVGAEVAELRAEMRRRNAEREKNAELIHQVWRPLSLSETAELMVSEQLRERAKARKGGAQ